MNQIFSHRIPPSAGRTTTSLAGLLIAVAILVPGMAVASPTLGNYPNTSLFLSTDTTVTPDAAPTGTNNINVSTSTDFKGTLVADRVTGVLRVTDGYPAGTYTVTITAFDKDGATASKTLTLTVTTPVTCLPVNFATAVNYTTGSFPQSLAVGDFNGDGKQDLAVADLASDVVAILLGDGAGNFNRYPRLFLAGDNAQFVAVGDFNGDGQQDLAVPNRDAETISILLGKGRGNFRLPFHFTGNLAPQSAVVGDFNTDGKQDLAVVQNSYPGYVSILLGDGTGRFGRPTTFSAGGNSGEIAIGDFNRDGNQDLAITSYAPNGIEILLGDGTGRFSAPATLPTADPTAVAVGDFNGDSKQVIAAPNYGAGGPISIFLGDGAGKFNPAPDVTINDFPNAVAVGDFNGDGKQDLVVSSTNGRDNYASILLGDGTGNFGAPLAFAVGNYPGAIAVGDFNGDGMQDLAVANGSSNNVSILLRDCSADQASSPRAKPQLLVPNR
jgi:hypothetical protein